MKKHIPNLLTSLNLFSGCLGVLAVLHFGRPDCAAYMIFVSVVFDFLDGMSARLLNAKSSIGLQLDSLADVVSFGVLPGTIIFQMMATSPNLPSTGTSINLLPFVALLIPVFSALRLAKFNVDERQTSTFLGLPTPASALLLGSLPLIQARAGYGFFMQDVSHVAHNFWVLLLLTLAACVLMVSEIPLFSLKFSNLKLMNNLPQYILLIFALVSFILFSFASLPFIILVYILLSLSLKPKSQED